jgi:hypothetical protein
MKLGGAVRAALKEARISQAAWARANWMSDGKWRGDACGCPDDRCIGHHHAEGEECRCFPALRDEYLDGAGFFAEYPPDIQRVLDETAAALELDTDAEREEADQNERDWTCG